MDHSFLSMSEDTEIYGVTEMEIIQPEYNPWNGVPDPEIYPIIPTGIEEMNPAENYDLEAEVENREDVEFMQIVINVNNGG